MTNAIQSLQHQKDLLKLEYEAEKEVFRQQAEAVGIARKVKRGDAWCPVRIGSTFYNSLNQLAVEVFRTSDTNIEHNFEFGRPVCFFSVERRGTSVKERGERSDEREMFDIHSEKGIFHPSSPNTHSSKDSFHTSPSSPYYSKKKVRYLPITGTVSFVDGDRMVVTVPEGSDLIGLQQTKDVGVQLFFDETSYRLMFEALDKVINAKGNRLAYLRDLFYSHQPAVTFGFDKMSFPWLNPTQERAVNEVLRAKDVMIVHGPPGTGKTTTLVEAIHETLRRESQVMVCAQSNMAVDWICEKLQDRGINVLRIGNPTKVTDNMLASTYERRFESHPDYPQLWAIRKSIREIRQRKKRGDERLHQKLERLKSRAIELELRIRSQLFGEARVIASTLVGSANHLLDGMKFATLFIDEAAQALEAACWIPMRRANRVIFAGDHCQLPPTVKSFEAMKGGLDKTLMERIVENKPEVVTLLTMQYRMNEQIMRFSSECFYGGKVVSAPEVRHRGILDYDLPMVWKDTSGMDCREQFVGESFGRINKTEAELTLKELETYFTKVGKERVLEESIDVGVISPYRAQVQYLRRLIKQRPFFKPYRRLITVNTVDGFQGQERDVILISLVRANDEGQIGFLSDLRRMNVAITRARMKLIILGDASTMTRHPFYKRLFDYVQRLKTIVE